MNHNNLKEYSPILTIITLILTGLFWLFTINGLPHRVSALESTVKILEQKMERNDVKTDLILDSVKLIQAHLLHYTPILPSRTPENLNGGEND